MHPEVKQARRHSFLSASHWPSAVGDKGASAKKVFAKKMSEFKSSASEAMALYPVMRAFLQEKLPNIRDHECRECCRCFFILCEVLDLLYETAAPQDPSTQAAALEQKIAAHLELFKRCYGVEKVIPKAHLNMHLGDLLRRHGVLLSCFVHERRHKEIKRYANNLDSMQAGSEKHILQLELEEHLKNLLVFSERKAGLVNPKAAAGLVQSAFCDFFSLPGCPGLLVSMSCHVGNGRLCKREDVVVVRGPNGDEVAQVWFHACPSGAIWGEIVFEPVRSLCSEQQMLSAGFVLSRKRVTVLWSYRSVCPCEDADITLQMSPFCRVPISQNAMQDMFAQSACKHLYRGCCEPYTRNRADHIATKDRSRSRNLGQHMNLIMSKNRASNEYVPLSPHAL